MGKKLTREHRRNLSRGKQRYWRAHLLGETLPERKRCSRCKKMKDAAAFSIRRYKRKSVPVVEKLDAACKRCNARIAKERRERRIAENVDVWAIDKARRERWKKGLSPAQLAEQRERHREWSASKRRKAGAAPRGAYGERRAPRPLHAGDRLDARPLVKLLKKELAFLAKERNEANNPGDYQSNGLGPLAEVAGVSQRRLYALLHGEQDLVALSTVDKLLVGLGLPHMLPILYPEA